ncbi:conserved hypothetical protein [Beutenbergia cavernae DSM 12333]|uniref:Kinase n=1 Tax=Beutenbergia cavernae (strain ATCC BAA-8 / DSM 12333 / CCUG 43141 / JCM 11478 / NBRC 16432 / NCIMB 13614 / HKI 0122) TaxID=471853 RepID=C5C6E0_BEUC1|nr:conserved hypothetical protein [Beutenbergia cavernae DSM 12333]
MPRLILLNGAPAVGKSTLAARYAAHHPMSLALDIDRVRGMLGGWADDPTAAGLLARELAVAMARTHLVAGHDVVVPQLLGRLEFIERLDALATEVDVTFLEVVVVAEREEAWHRFDARSAAPENREHVDAATLVRRAGGDTAFHELYDRVRDAVAQRPATRVVESVADDVDATYAALERVLG